MAKDVDLSSKEWTDIVFEGKNKEFGAYTMRQNSPKRHTLAVIIVLGVLAVLLVFLILMVTGVFKTAEEDANAQGQMTNADIAQNEDEEDEEEDDIIIPDEEDEIIEPEIIEEEVTATQELTSLDLKVEVDEEHEMKDPDEILDNTEVLGTQNQIGAEDLNKVAAIAEVVDKKPEDKPEERKEEIATIATVEQKPSFPGGEAAMYKWLGEQIVYPAQASEEGASGKVTVAFIIEKDGSVSNVQVVRGKHPALDAEAVRVVKKMPKWTPGRNNGVPVRVAYNLPVTFKLQ